jgi:hypothetical protein
MSKFKVLLRRWGKQCSNVWIEARALIFVEALKLVIEHLVKK